MKKIAAYIMLLFIGLLGSCQGNEEFKLPTKVGFQMDINRNTGQNGRLNFTHGQIILASFSFDGRREEGGDVFFTKSYDEGLLINFDSGNTIAPLTFQIPQGNYTRIELELETSDDTGVPGLVVEGWYLHSSGIRYPVRFELESSVEFEIKAKEHSGSHQIVLIHTKPASPIIRLNPLKWFEAVPASFLENAVSTIEEGESEDMTEEGSYILINEETNEEIYEIIIARIEQSVEVIF